MDSNPMFSLLLISDFLLLVHTSFSDLSESPGTKGIPIAGMWPSGPASVARRIWQWWPLAQLQRRWMPPQPFLSPPMVYGANSALTFPSQRGPGDQPFETKTQHCQFLSFLCPYSFTGHPLCVHQELCNAVGRR